MRASTVGGKAPPRTAGRPLAPRPSSKNKTLMIVGGVVVLLVIIVVAVLSTNPGNSGGGKKNTPNNDSSNKTGKIEPGGRDTARVVEHTPPDMGKGDFPLPANYGALKEEYAALKDSFPTDLTAIAEEELKTLHGRWDALILKIQETDFSGHERKKQDLLAPAKQKRVDVKIEIDRREELRKKGQNP